VIVGGQGRDQLTVRYNLSGEQLTSHDRSLRLAVSSGRGAPASASACPRAFHADLLESRIIDEVAHGSA